MGRGMSSDYQDVRSGYTPQPMIDSTVVSGLHRGTGRASLLFHLLATSRLGLESDKNQNKLGASVVTALPAQGISHYYLHLPADFPGPDD